VGGTVIQAQDVQAVGEGVGEGIHHEFNAVCIQI
jgi:hypothetical protein